MVLEASRVLFNCAFIFLTLNLMFYNLKKVTVKL